MDVEDAYEQIESFFKEMPMINDIQKSRMHAAHLEVVKEILDSMKNEEGKVKKFKGGRFEKIEQKQPEEGEEEKPKTVEDEISPKWIDHGPKPRDVAGLIFNIFLHKINVGLSLESRTIMSIDGSSIYVVVKADDLDLKRTAEANNFTMQLAIGLTDLSSLEPCDKYYRPFRKCENKPKDIHDLEDKLEEYFSVVEGNVGELLKEEPLEYQKEEGIIGDFTKSDLATYREYLKTIIVGYDDFKRHTYKRPHMKGVHLKNMAVKALKEANIRAKSVGGSKLYNLWERMKIGHVIGAYADFKDDQETEYLWRKYICDETLSRSLFRDSDKIKLTNMILNTLIYNKKLVQKGYLSGEFPFHNEFDLFGEHRFDFSTREDNMENEEVELQAKELFSEDIPQGLNKSWR